MNRITKLAANEVFVFGSNLAGKHYGGAARDAHERFGAEIGVGRGMTGQCYALPTLDERFERLPLAAIKAHVEMLKTVAQIRPEYQFILTPVGCGIAGFEAHEIAPMFKDSPANVIMPDEFKAYL